MDKAKLFDALDGLFAWDMGCTDSGIHDAKLEDEVQDFLEKSPDADKLLAEFIETHYANERQRTAGYGYGDIIEFVTWFKGWSRADY